MTAAEALTWIGWGEVRPKERVAEFEAELLELWGVSGNRFNDLITAFESGQAHPRLVATPAQVRDHIQDRVGRDFTFAELAVRLKEDRTKLVHEYELLELASEVVVKACVDGEVTAVGRLGSEPDRRIPTEIFVQHGVQVTWWDTIETDRCRVGSTCDSGAETCCASGRHRNQTARLHPRLLIRGTDAAAAVLQSMIGMHLIGR